LNYIHKSEVRSQSIDEVTFQYCIKYVSFISITDLSPIHQLDP